jgi:hypothetical protein
LSLSVLCSDLLSYYKNKQLLASAEHTLERLKSLNADYQALLEQLEKDPNLLGRAAGVTFGKGKHDDNTAYPKATPEQLDAARKALTEESAGSNKEIPIPRWLTRCSEPRRRKMLFVSGAVLVMISFVFFGFGKPIRQDPSQSKQ